MYEFKNDGFRESSDRSHDFSTLSSYRDHSKCNGHLTNSILHQSKPNLNQNLSLSRRSLGNVSKVTVYGKDYGIQKSLASLGLLSALSLVVTVIALQLIFRFHAIQSTVATTGRHRNGTLLNTSWCGNVLETAIALTSFVLMLDVCCLLACSLQFFYASKLLKVSQGEERAFKYLKDCSGTRFIAVSGFFISVPSLLLAILLFMLIEFQSMTAIISSTLLSLGVLFCLIIIGHNTYRWRCEKNRANNHIPPFGGSGKIDPSTKSELSTLV